MSIITRRIQLLICDYDKSEKMYSVVEKNNDVYKKTWSELNKLNFYCPKISNLVISKLIKNTNFMEENFIHNKENKRDDDYRIAKQILEELKIDFDGYSQILKCVSKNAMEKLKRDKKDVKLGNKSVATFKKGMPIPFQSQKKSFVKQDSDYYITLFKLHFKLYFGRDKSNDSNNRSVVEKIKSGYYKFCDSSIQIKDGKIFLLLTVRIPEEKHILDKNICLGVDIGMSVPAYLALSSNPYYKKSLGSFREYTKMRLALQYARKRIQSFDIGVNGKGRVHKNKKLVKIKSVETDYADTYEHLISKWVVNEAIKNNAGTIKLENLKGFDKPFGLRNMGYYGFQSKIEQKAQKNGIDVVYINPRNTSKTCNKCGNIEKELDCLNKNKKMNKKREWTCSNCSEILQRDWNAAFNIANSIEYLEK